MVQILFFLLLLQSAAVAVAQGKLQLRQVLLVVLVAVAQGKERLNLAAQELLIKVMQAVKVEQTKLLIEIQAVAVELVQ
jgi:hypothetical protein